MDAYKPMAELIVKSAKEQALAWSALPDAPVQPVPPLSRWARITGAITERRARRRATKIEEHTTATTCRPPVRMAVWRE